MHRRLQPLAALGMAALIATGCSSTGSASGAASGASAGAGSGSAGSASAAPASAHEKGVKFAECMRSNGVPHFPDPDPKGEFAFGVDVSRDVFTRAADACKSLLPPGALSAKRSPQEQAAALRFAQCVRENGVTDFPDPVNGQPLIDTYKIPSSHRPGGMTILNAATAKCDHIAKQAAGGQG